MHGVQGVVSSNLTTQIFFKVIMCFRTVFVSLFLLCFIHLEASTAIRTAIEIGMGGPKLQIAEVDVDSNKIVKTLYTKRYFVNFYDKISPGNQLSLEMMEEGLQAFKEAVSVAKTFNPEGVVAVATASFRSATNGIEFANHIQDETGIKVHILDQQLEGKLTYQAVLSKTNFENLIVWDIGAGSIQFITKIEDGSYLVDCGKEGVGAFKDQIIKHIQKRSTQDFKSPNPMSSQDIVLSTAYARDLANRIQNGLKDKINIPQTTIVGAGSVFGLGIAGLLSHKTQFNVEDLASIVDRLAGKTDEDLGGGDFAFVEGSNAILVLGFMQALNIKQMHIINVNNADGAMTYQPFWE